MTFIPQETAALRTASSASHAARMVLAFHGIRIDDFVAEQVADAVLGHADNYVSVRETIPRHMWDNPDARAYMTQSMRRRLLEEITSHGCIPTALPTEALRYTSFHFGPDIADDASDQEPPEWDQALITLSVPVRTPPIDRKAAVKAGLLTPETPTP